MSRRAPVRATDLLHHRVPRDVQLAADGTVVWSEQSIDAAADRARARLWVRHPDAPPGVLTGLDYVDTAPRICPAGRRVAFLRSAPERKGEQAVCVVGCDGAGERELVWVRGSLGPPSWSPDGRTVCLASRAADAVPEGWDTVRSIRVTRKYYKADGGGYLPRDRWSLALLDVDAEEPELRPLTQGPWDDTAPAWSPDGARVAFRSTRAAPPEDETGGIDIYVVPASGGEPVRCTHGPGVREAPCWSADGTVLAVVGARCPPMDYLFRSRATVWAVDPSGAEPERALVPDLDRCALNLTVDDVWGLAWEAGPAITDDGRVVVPVTDCGTTALLAVALDGSGYSEVFRGDVVHGFAVHDQRLALVTTHPTAPGLIRLGLLGDREPPVVAWPLKHYAAHTELPAPVELIVHTDADSVHGRALRTENSEPASAVLGARPRTESKSQPERSVGRSERIERISRTHPVQGWLLVPPGPGPHPLLVDIHGGPVVQFGRGFFHELAWLAARGYAVLYGNPRGSRGFGDAFAAALHRNWADPAMADVLALLDHALEHDDRLDASRIGVMGGSYGGYLTNMLVAHSDRFRAACTQRTVSDLANMMWSDFGSGIGAEFDGWPWEDPEVYARLSPLTHIERMQTPMLILQGLADQRTPPDQGERLYVALRAVGTPVEMVLFPGGTHDLSRTGRPSQRIERLQIIGAWFDRWLRPDA